MLRIKSDAKYAVLVLFGSVSLWACGHREMKNISFENDIQPILKDNCLHCHNASAKKGSLNFESFDSLMASRYFNSKTPVVIPTKPEESRLYLSVHSNNIAIRMPPANFGYVRLDDDEIMLIKTWISEGGKNN